MDFPLWARVGVGVGLAAMLAYFATPVAIVTAKRLAFYDKPAGYKAHAAPTPYLGGAAVMLAFALAVLIGAGDPSRTVPLLGGVALLLVVGTIDDRRTVSWFVRVLVEFLIGFLLGIDGIGWHLGAGVLVDGLVMGVWVVAVVNAFNLFDNMDGAASTMALVVGAGSCILGIVSGNTWVAAGSAALCGACLGFLPHNLASPAKIFLGDGGSMPLGFAVAALVANAANTVEPSSLGLLVGFLLVGVPALDTCLVIFSRRRRGVSILTGGQDHLTHRTRERVRTSRRVVMVLGSAQALVSALVIVATRAGSTSLVYILLAFMVAAATTIGALESADASRQIKITPSSPAFVVKGRAGEKLTAAALFLLGIAAGLSPLFSGYYDIGVWVPMTLVLVVITAAVCIARTPRLGWPGALALAGTAGLGLWSLLSSTWASGVELSVVEGNRWLAYAALLLLLLTLLRDRRQAVPLLVGVGVGIGLVGATVLGRMIVGDGFSLFVGGRLNGPLGYINGEGCVFAMACWFGLALAERRQAVLAGVGMALTVAAACLAVLSESRGAAIATFVAIILVLAVVPGLRRRLLTLAAVAVGFAAVAGTVAHVYSSGGTPSAIQSAGIAIFMASVIAGLLWGGAVEISNRLLSRGGDRVLAMNRLATAAAIAVVAIPLLLAAVNSGSIAHTLSTQYHAFVHLSDQGSANSTQTRLFSGAGDRYDYWRVAWKVFTAHPLGGVGAGNYPASYYVQRHTTEAIQNPHSFVLQTLSELGVVGGLLLALLIAGVALGIRQLRTAARASAATRTVMVAATGAAIVWFVDASGDWMQLLPGVAAVALAAIAILARGATTAGARRRPLVPALRGSRIPTFAGAAVIAFALAVAGASLLRTGLTQLYVGDARAELSKHPAAAVEDAGRAIRLDGANLDAYYLRAAGLARFDRVADAQSSLLQAAREDPTNFVTWTLLGDLSVRVRNFTAAKSFYERAHELDPKDPGLARLAANPATALSAGSTGG